MLREVARSHNATGEANTLPLLVGADEVFIIMCVVLVLWFGVAFPGKYVLFLFYGLRAWDGRCIWCSAELLLQL